MFEAQDTPASTTSQRVERKYPLPDSMLDVALTELRRVLPVYHHVGVHDWASIRTTYLDTVDLTCYREYLERLPVRRKIRIRQYGVNGEFENACWVEIKVKNHALSLKRRFRCLTSDLMPLIKGEDILDRIAGQNTEDISQTFHVIRSMILEQELVPAVRIRYERMSFQPHGSDDLRVTFDRDVRFVSPCRRFVGPLEGLIIEVKHHGDMPPLVRELRNKLGMRRVKRFSKFARGIERLSQMREREEAR